MKQYKQINLILKQLTSFGPSFAKALFTAGLLGAAALGAITPQAAQAITLVSANVIEDTSFRLRIDWFGANLNNGLYDIQFQMPTLVHWSIGDISVTTPGGGSPWSFAFNNVRHVTNPHLGETDALSISSDIFIINYTGGYQTGGWGGSVLHPGHGRHLDFYNLSYAYGNPLGSPPNSNLAVTLLGIHPVPGPLPILGVGAVLGFSRKLRKRINASKKPAMFNTIG